MTSEDQHIIETVRGCWADALQVPIEEITDASNFFGDGGDSLIAVELVVDISESIGSEVQLDALFQDGTFSSLVAATRAAVERPGN